MARENQLRDQIQDLFSEIAVPEPQAPEGVAPEAAPDELPGVPQQTASHSAPFSAVPGESSDAQPTLPTAAPHDESQLYGVPRSEETAIHSSVSRWKSSLRHKLILAFLATALIPSVIIAAFGGTILVTLLAMTLTAILASQVAKRIAQPVTQITESAKQIVDGNLDQIVEINRSDELGALGRAFNDMANQLRRTIAGLEETVTDRTRQLQEANYQFQKRAIHLEASAEVSRAAASILDPQELMQTIVDLIRDRFSFYHVSFFLLDDTGTWAVVRASTGDVGRQMVAQPHQLAVGEASMVGWACAHRQPRIAFDVGTDAVHFDNPLLPDTRSELVLPLTVGDDLLGALDVQSSREAAFDDDDVRTLQSMADSVAVALQNARLFTETRQSVQHQRLVARVSDHLQRAASVTDILTLTLGELGDAFDLARAAVCLGTETELVAAGSEHSQEADLLPLQGQPRSTER